MNFNQWIEKKAAPNPYGGFSFNDPWGYNLLNSDGSLNYNIFGYNQFNMGQQYPYGFTLPPNILQASTLRPSNMPVIDFKSQLFGSGKNVNKSYTLNNNYQNNYTYGNTHYPYFNDYLRRHSEPRMQSYGYTQPVTTQQPTQTNNQSQQPAQTNSQAQQTTQQTAPATAQNPAKKKKQGIDMTAGDRHAEMYMSLDDPRIQNDSRYSFLKDNIKDLQRDYGRGGYYGLDADGNIWKKSKNGVGALLAVTTPQERAAIQRRSAANRTPIAQQQQQPQRRPVQYARTRRANV